MADQTKTNGAGNASAKDVQTSAGQLKTGLDKSAAKAGSDPKSDVSEPTDPKSDAPKAERIAVTTSNPGGRRRAGLAFGLDPQEIDLADLSEEQLVQIKSDPALSVKQLA